MGWSHMILRPLWSPGLQKKKFSDCCDHTEQVFSDSSGCKETANKCCSIGHRETTNEISIYSVLLTACLFEWYSWLGCFTLQCITTFQIFRVHLKFYNLLCFSQKIKYNKSRPQRVRSTFERNTDAVHDLDLERGINNEKRTTLRKIFYLQHKEIRTDYTLQTKYLLSLTKLMSNLEFSDSGDSKKYIKNKSRQKFWVTGERTQTRSENPSCGQRSCQDFRRHFVE